MSSAVFGYGKMTMSTWSRRAGTRVCWVAVLIFGFAADVAIAETTTVRVEDICVRPRFSKLPPPIVTIKPPLIPTVWPLELFRDIDEGSRDPSTMESPVSLGAYTFDAFESRTLIIPSYLTDVPSSPTEMRILSYLPDAFRDQDELLLEGGDIQSLDDLVSGWNLFVPVLGDGSIDQGDLLRRFGLPSVRPLSEEDFRSCALLPAFKVDPLINRGDDLLVQLFRTVDRLGVRDFVEAKDGDWLGGADDSGLRFRLRVADAQTIYELARRPDVAAIQRGEVIELRNRGTAGMLQTGDPEWPLAFRSGLKGQGQVIGIVDAPFDPRHCFFFDPTRPIGDTHRKLKAYFGDLPDARGEATSHGTLVAGIVTGLDPLDPDDPKNGQAPESKLVFTDIARVRPTGFFGNSIFNILEEQYLAGARVFSLSWGDDLCLERAHMRTASQVCPVTSLGRDLDRFARRREDALVIVAVSNGVEITSPENALNPLAVGASGQGGGGSSIYQCSQNDQCSENRLGSGGTGPAIGGRRKPELFVPGCHVVSAREGTICDLAQAPGAQRHTSEATDCATSWAAPAAAGAAALVRQYYREGWYPSGTAVVSDACYTTGALVKATLLNATVDMNQSGYPSDQEGWGRLELDDTLYFAGQGPKLLAVEVKNGEPFAFRTAGRTATYDFEVQQKGPVKITLAWTQPVNRWPTPNPDGNDLDLVVAVDGKYYCGNDPDMDAVAGNPPREKCESCRDTRNNVEQVWLPQVPAGRYQLTIRSQRIQRQAQQGYALVVSGGSAPTVKQACAGMMWK